MPERGGNDGAGSFWDWLRGRPQKPDSWVYYQGPLTPRQLEAVIEKAKADHDKRMKAMG